MNFTSNFGTLSDHYTEDLCNRRCLLSKIEKTCACRPPYVLRRFMTPHIKVIFKFCYWIIFIISYIILEKIFYNIFYVAMFVHWACEMRCANHPKLSRPLRVPSRMHLEAFCNRLDSIRTNEENTVRKLCQFRIQNFLAPILKTILWKEHKMAAQSPPFKSTWQRATSSSTKSSPTIRKSPRFVSKWSGG